MSKSELLEFIKNSSCNHINSCSDCPISNFRKNDYCICDDCDDLPDDCNFKVKHPAGKFHCKKYSVYAAKLFIELYSEAELMEELL